MTSERKITVASISEHRADEYKTFLGMCPDFRQI